MAKQKTAAEKVTALLRAKELGRRQYAKADRLLEELLKVLTVGEEIELQGGKRATLKDNYAGTNKVFRAHGISRYEVEVKP